MCVLMEIPKLALLSSLLKLESIIYGAFGLHLFLAVHVYVLSLVCDCLWLPVVGSSKSIVFGASCQEEATAFDQRG